MENNWAGDAQQTKFKLQLGESFKLCDQHSELNFPSLAFFSPKLIAVSRKFFTWNAWSWQLEAWRAHIAYTPPMPSMKCRTREAWKKPEIREILARPGLCAKWKIHKH